MRAAPATQRMLNFAARLSFVDAPMRTLSLTLALAVALALTACGYKTALTLPKPNSAAPAPDAIKSEAK